jgi:hypothetical protein
LHELCAYGKERSVGITLESFDRTVEKGSLIGPSNEALMISKAIRKDYPDFGLMYDMGHAPLLNEDPEESLKLGNCVKKPGLQAYGDQHPRFGLAGGENDVSQLVTFLRALVEIGYIPSKPKDVSPVIGFELKAVQGEKSESVITNGKRVWKKAWSLL